MPNIDDISLRETLVHEAYRQARGGIPMTVLAIAAIVWIHWLDYQHVFSPSWVSSMLLVLALRAVLVAYVLKQGTRIPLPRREWLFCLPLHLVSLCWAALPFVSFAQATDYEKFGTLCILSGMAGGAATILAPLKWSARFYLFCLLIPGALTIELDIIGPVISLLGFCFFGLMVLGHASARRLLIDATQERLRNQNLLRDLEQQRSDIERLNCELRTAEAALRQQNTQLEHEVAIRTERNRLAFSVVQNTSEGVMVIDPDGHIVEINPAFTSITGFSAADAIGQPASILLAPQQTHESYAAVMHRLRSDGTWAGDMWSQRKDGSHFLEHRTIDAIRNGDGATTHYVVVFKDITESFRKDEQLRHLASHDPLTGLANRSLLHEHIQKQIAHAKLSGQGFAVLFLDLDHFKGVNDTLGHDIGDQLLRLVSGRFLACLGEKDSLSRLGGDEFVVLMGEIGQRKECAQLAERLLDSLRTPLRIADTAVYAKTSIGIACFPEDGQSIDTLMKNADMALYAAKAAGKNRYDYFHPSLSEKASARRELETALREALEQGQLQLHFQPKVDARNGRIHGFEALLRWHRPGFGNVSPERLIPVAEEAGLISSVGEQVIELACRQMAEWHAQGLGWQNIAVNVSARQFSDHDLVGIVFDNQHAHGIPAGHLEIEVTESVLMTCPEKTLPQLARLRESGVRIAIDDFGTGHSSLAYLKNLPVDILKIDRSFVEEAETDAASQAIIDTIVALSRALSKTVVAEGVETNAQAKLLLHAGCDQLQGYHLAPPMPAAEVVASGLLSPPDHGDPTLATMNPAIHPGISRH